MGEWWIIHILGTAYSNPNEFRKVKFKCKGDRQADRQGRRETNCERDKKQFESCVPIHQGISLIQQQL